MTRIGERIKQGKPFSGPEHEVFLALQRLSSELAQGVAELLKPRGLSGAQFNVLRILRGAGESGLACGEVAERLVAKDPDMTRLLDRLEKQGLVERERSTQDRRVVTARITPQGLEVLGELDEPLAELHRRQLGHLGAEKLEALRELLEAASGD